MAGPWLAETLHGLRSPQALAALDPGTALQAALRPYQQAGVRWLHLLAQLGLGIPLRCPPLNWQPSTPTDWPGPCGA